MPLYQRLSRSERTTTAIPGRRGVGYYHPAPLYQRSSWSERTTTAVPGRIDVASHDPISLFAGTEGIVVNSWEGLMPMIDTIERLPTDSPQLFLDFRKDETDDRFDTLTIFLPLTNFAYIVDAQVFSSALFARRNKEGSSLQIILGSRTVIKVFYDVRKFAEWSTAHRVHLLATEDVQLMELESTTSGEHNMQADGLEQCIQDYAALSIREKGEWEASRAAYLRMLELKGKEVDHLKDEALNPADVVRRHCVNNIRFLPRVREKLWEGLDSTKRDRVINQTKIRIAEAQESGDIQGPVVGEEQRFTRPGRTQDTGSSEMSSESFVSASPSQSVLSKPKGSEAAPQIPIPAPRQDSRWEDKEYLAHLRDRMRDRMVRSHRVPEIVTIRRPGYVPARPSRRKSPVSVPMQPWRSRESSPDWQDQESQPGVRRRIPPREPPRPQATHIKHVETTPSQPTPSPSLTIPRHGAALLRSPFHPNNVKEVEKAETYALTFEEVEKDGLSVSLPMRKKGPAITINQKNDVQLAPAYNFGLAWEEATRILPGASGSSELLIIQAAEFSTDDSGQGKITIVCPMGPRKIDPSPVEMRWLHVQRPNLDPEVIQRLVWNCPFIAYDLRSVAMTLLEEVQKRFTGKSDRGVYMEPGSVLRSTGRYTDTDIPVEETETDSVIFLACPYLALGEDSKVDVYEPETNYQAQTLLQSLYGYDVGRERELSQVAAKMSADTPKTDLLHVCQTWCLLIGPDILITMSGQSAQHLRGESVVIDSSGSVRAEPLMMKTISPKGQHCHVVVELGCNYVDFLNHVVARAGDTEDDPSDFELLSLDLQVLTPSKWLEILSSTNSPTFIFHLRKKTPKGDFSIHGDVLGQAIVLRSQKEPWQQTLDPSSSIDHHTQPTRALAQRHEDFPQNPQREVDLRQKSSFSRAISSHDGARSLCALRYEQYRPDYARSNKGENSSSTIPRSTPPYDRARDDSSPQKIAEQGLLESSDTHHPEQSGARITYRTQNQSRADHGVVGQERLKHSQGPRLEYPKGQVRMITSGGSLNMSAQASNNTEDGNNMQLVLHRDGQKHSSIQSRVTQDQSRPNYHVNQDLSSALIRRANAGNSITFNIQSSHGNLFPTSREETRLVLRHKSTESLSRTAKPIDELPITHPKTTPTAGHVINHIPVSHKPAANVFELAETPEGENTQAHRRFAFVEDASESSSLLGENIKEEFTDEEIERIEATRRYARSSEDFYFPFEERLGTRTSGRGVPQPRRHSSSTHPITINNGIYSSSATPSDTGTELYSPWTDESLSDEYEESSSEDNSTDYGESVRPSSGHSSNDSPRRDVRFNDLANASDQPNSPSTPLDTLLDPVANMTCRSAPFLTWRLTTETEDRTDEEAEITVVKILSAINKALSSSGAIRRIYPRAFKCTLQDLMQRHDCLQDSLGLSENTQIPGTDNMAINSNVGSKEKLEDMHEDKVLGGDSILADQVVHDPYPAATSTDTQIRVDVGSPPAMEGPRRENGEQDIRDNPTSSTEPTPTNVHSTSLTAATTGRDEALLMKQLLTLSQDILWSFVPPEGSPVIHHVPVRFWGSIDNIFRVSFNHEQQLIWSANESACYPDAQYSIRNFTMPIQSSLKETQPPERVPPNRAWDSCPDCRSGKRYATPTEALEHLHKAHFDCPCTTERPYDDACYVWVCRFSIDEKNKQPRYLGISDSVEDFIETLTPIRNFVDELHLLVASVWDNGVHDRKVSQPLLPRNLVMAFEKIVSLYVMRSRYLSLKNRLYAMALNPGPSGQLSTLRENIETLQKWEESVKDNALELLDSAKKDIILLGTTSRNVNSLGVESVGAEFLALTLIANMQNQCIRANLALSTTQKTDYVDLYRAYTSKLRFQANRRPQKRVFLDIHALQEELDALSGVIEAQKSLLDKFLRVLKPGSFRITNESRMRQSLTESLFAQAQQAKLLGREAKIHILKDKSNALKGQVKQTIEILEEDHGKAIRVFTIVTLFFLPLSFMSSFMGMNTTDIRDMGYSQKIFWSTAVPVTATVVTAAFLYGYRGEEIRGWFSGKMDSGKRHLAARRLKKDGTGVVSSQGRFSEKDVVRQQTMDSIGI
ncbi:Fc.00g114170.m01.CDS01 [Cosmosporella sp. VM-42]